MRRVRIDFSLTPAQAGAAFVAFTIVNCIVLIGTWSFAFYYRNPDFDWQSTFWTRYVLPQLNVAGQTILAAWYESMLLLLVGVVSLMCFLVDRLRRHDRYGLSLGWLVLAVAFILASLDEFGSLRAQLGLNTVPAGGDWGARVGVPVVVIATFLLGFGWAHVRAADWAAPFFVLGLMRFAMVPLQHETGMALLEQARRTDSWTVYHMMLVLQGAARLFGTLCFLTAAAIYVVARGGTAAQRPRDRRSGVAFDADYLVVALGVVVVIFAAGFTLARSTLGDAPPELGFAWNWFPSVLAIFAAVTAIYIASVIDPRWIAARRCYWLAAAYFTLISAYLGAAGYLYGYGGAFYSLGVFAHIVVAVTGLVTGVWLARQVDELQAKLAAVLWALLVAAGVTVLRDFASYLMLVAFSALLVSLPFHLHRWRPEEGC